MIEILNSLFLIISLFLIFSFPLSNKIIVERLGNYKLSFFDSYIINILFISNCLLVLSFFELKILYICTVLYFLAIINLFYVKKKFFTNEIIIISFCIFFILIYFVHISAYPYLEWDASVNWIFKVLNFYNDNSFENLKNLPGVIEYPHIGTYLWAMFWKISFINDEFTGRIIYFFIYFTSIFAISNLIKTSITNRIFLIIFITLISYDSILFSGYQECLLFSLCIMFLIILDKIRKNQDTTLYIFSLILVGNLLIWTKNEGIFIICFLSIFLFYNNDLGTGKKNFIFLAFICLIFIKKLAYLYYFDNFFLGWKGYEFITINELFSYASLMKLFGVGYQLIISFFKYPIYLISLIILILNFKKKYLIKYWLFFIIYALFTCAIFFFTNDDRWYFHTAVGLDRIMYQTSGIYIFLIVEYFKEYIEK